MGNEIIKYANAIKTENGIIINGEEYYSINHAKVLIGDFYVFNSNKDIEKFELAIKALDCKEIFDPIPYMIYQDRFYISKVYVENKIMPFISTRVFSKNSKMLLLSSEEDIDCTVNYHCTRMSIIDNPKDNEFSIIEFSIIDNPKDIKNNFIKNIFEKLKYRLNIFGNKISNEDKNKKILNETLSIVPERKKEESNKKEDKNTKNKNKNRK